MAINIARGKSDEVIDKIIEFLRAYQNQHPNAEIDIYRQNSVSLRVRVIDPDFAVQGKPQRNKEVWEYLRQLPEDAQSDISTVLSLTPDERRTSFANLEFEDSVASRL